MPVKTVTGSLRVSTPEATALDLLRYVAAAGYLSNVATVLHELAEACDAGRLVEAAQTAALPQAQRLGSLLDLVARSQLADPLARWLAERRPDWTRLDPGQPARRARRELRWHVLRLLRQASRLERAAPRRQEGRTLLARCAEESRASPRGGPALAAHRTDRATSPPRGASRCPPVALLAAWQAAPPGPASSPGPGGPPPAERPCRGPRLTAGAAIPPGLHGVAFNASLCVNATPAVLFRLIEETRPTLLVDEAEALESDHRRELLGIINAGYKRGATVPRVEGDRPRRVEFFDVFTPIALAGIRGLHATTEDRCLPLVMQRGSDRARVNAEVNPEAPALARIRDGCYRLLLTRSGALAA
ncbi:MAG TPA: hypothetical protein DCQ64_22585, partial [Candidatus Rokubacteria bacterium]|nr:hypothetical protein [Candidatus Rokubacteria bacterium]